MAGQNGFLEYSLSNSRCVLSENSSDAPRSLSVRDRTIGEFGGKSDLDFDLENTHYIYPGLINVHDHLRGDYLPRVGPAKNEYYLNWSPWDKDLKASPVFAERANISIAEAYGLGAYKNLFSGVTTVNDHFPHEFNEPFLASLPIRVISEYTLAHECSSYDLNWGDGIEIEYRRALDRGHPFITHLEEGYDEESQRGVEILENLGCLGDHGVFIHCIGFSEADILKVKKAESHVVWCPASNIFMFNLTCKIKRFMEMGLKVSLGTDSTHTGSINILEEMRFARKTYRDMYGEILPAETVFQMVTMNPARAFRMQEKIGSLEAGKSADILVTKKLDTDPFESLLQTELEDIELLVLEGRPIYGSEKFEKLFRRHNVRFTEIVMRAKPMLVVGDPAGLLRGIREKVGFPKNLEFMPLNV